MTNLGRNMAKAEQVSTFKAALSLAMLPIEQSRSMDAHLVVQRCRYKVVYSTAP